MEASSKLFSMPLAHRGLHSGQKLPENSMRAFEHAAELGYGIELDVQLLDDDKIAVFHDYDLKRMTGMRGDIRSLNSTKIGNARLYDTEHKIPLLDEVLDLIDGRVPLLIEIKNERHVGKFENLVKKSIDGYKGDLAIQSFNPYSVNWFKKNSPAIARGILSGNFKDRPDISGIKYQLLRNVFLAPIITPDFISYQIEAIDAFRLFLIQNIYNTPLLIWTVKNQFALNFAKSLNANFIFEEIMP